MSISIHKISILTVSLLLATTTVLAEKKDYIPADPSAYPYDSVVKDKQGREINVDGAIILDQNFDVNDVYHSPYDGKGYNLGKKATVEQVNAWDTDVRPDGKGLPKGSMTAGEGMNVYIEKCGTCHGDFGEGVDRFPSLSGGFGTLTLKPETGGDPGPHKTIGSYLPYIAPMYWYIQTAMPLSAPKSLSNSEVYGILGYLLMLNEIEVKGQPITDDTVVDKTLIKAVEMPNEKGFEYNNLRKPDTQNTRCMKDCVDLNKVTIKRIETDGTQVEPSFGEERWYYGPVEVKSEKGGVGEEVYQATCAGCHDSGIAGSPKIGDKKAWAKILKQDKETILSHSINGFNAMPPKGGDPELSDEKVKKAVEYMIEKSK